MNEGKIVFITKNTGRKINLFNPPGCKTALKFQTLSISFQQAPLPGSGNS
jgi:hypothetical protein